jgi:hypothetical protein
VILGLALIVAAVVERQDPSRSTATADQQVQAKGPAAIRPAAGSSSWYCAGGTAAPNSLADGTVVIANPGRRPLSGSVTVVAVTGQSAPAPVQVGAANRATVRLGDVIAAPFASALVELDGGEAVVELATTGPLGDSVSPCASTASDQWYFAEGATTKDASETLVLYNPFPDDAVINIVFSTDEGQVVPQALTGFAIPGQAMSVVAVGDHVQRRDAVATTITAQRGRLVAARLQTFDGSAGRKGASVALGSPTTATTSYFPEGEVGDGLTERFQIFNPSNQEATVELRLALEQGQAEPIVVAVPPQSRHTVVANDEARIPKQVPHAVTVVATGGGPDGRGLPVVAERTIDAVAPSKRTGLAIMPGALVASDRSAFAVGEADENADEWLVLMNPGPRPATVGVTVLADGIPTSTPPLQGIDVPPGQRRAVHIDDSVKRATTPLVIQANVPIVTERDLYRTKSLGTSMTTGIPILGG